MIESHGSAIVAFHDLRDALRCLRHVRTDNFFASRRLDTHFVSIVTIIEVSAYPHLILQQDKVSNTKMVSQGYKIPFMDMVSGKICISGENGENLDFRLVRELLEQFGEIYSLDALASEKGKLITCEYYDRRSGIQVIERIHGRDIFVLAPLS